ncbi:MAG: type II secretion system F family protein [Vampirovibrio sp.]|nr:type II secretion system F family protein [Vampirovibrio sp.]
MTPETLLIILIAATVFLLLVGFYKTSFEKKVQAQEHIQGMLAGKKGAGAMGRGGQNEDILRKRNKEKDSFIARLETDLERANLLLRVNELIMICLVTAVLGFLISNYLMVWGMIISILTGIGSFFIPFLYLKIRIFLRMQKAVEQFSDVLDAMVNCFKTGFGFNRAIQVIATNFEDPWGTEFGKMAMELNLGASQDDVLYNMAQRVPSPDVDLFVTALVIQKETGGNLAELLGNLSNTIRERYKLFRKVSALSAQGKLSATIICLIPFALMGLMYVLLHEPTVQFISNPIGIALMVAVSIWMALGVAVLFKIVSIEV